MYVCTFWSRCGTNIYGCLCSLFLTGAIRRTSKLCEFHPSLLFLFFFTKLHPVTAIESLLTFIAEYDLLLFLIFLPLVFFLNILSLYLIPHVFQYTSLSPLTPPHWCCLGCGHRQPKGEHKVQSECWSVWLGRRGQTQHAPRHQHRFTWWELVGIYWKADDVFF